MVPYVVVVGAYYGDLAARRGYVDAKLAIDEEGIGPVWVLERDGGASETVQPWAAMVTTSGGELGLSGLVPWAGVPVRGLS